MIQIRLGLVKENPSDRTRSQSNIEPICILVPPPQGAQTCDKNDEITDHQPKKDEQSTRQPTANQCVVNKVVCDQLASRQIARARLVHPCSNKGVLGNGRKCFTYQARASGSCHITGSIQVIVQQKLEVCLSGGITHPIDAAANRQEDQTPNRNPLSSSRAPQPNRA